MRYSDANLTLHHLVAVQAECQPSSIALRSVYEPPQSGLTYEALHSQITKVTRILTAHGIQPNDRIAVVLPNGTEMAVVFLAIASCATCAPLNPNYQRAEFDFYLDDLQAKALIILAGQPSPARSSAQARNIPILDLIPTSAGQFELEGHAVCDGHPEFAKPDDVALILHTSGTTSRPKMVPLTHRNLWTSANNVATTLELTPSDRCLSLMPLFHIHGLVGVLLASIAAGGQVICTPGFQATRFFDWFETFQPTWYSAVPTIHQAILAQAEQQRDRLEHSTLRLIRSSSAALPTQVKNLLEATFQVPVIEAYGMTEAAHQMTSNLLSPSDRKAGSVGKAIGLEVAIMDETGQLLQPSAIGEVVIRGANVTSGYEQNPEATAKALTQGWFRTGDQGYFDADGFLFLQGRLKEIINRGGEKIAPLEVDAVLMDIPEVFQAVTFAVPHPTLGEDVAAAVVLHPGANLSAIEIRQILFQKVADFKVPSQVVMVDAIPTGATGKLQRIGLFEKLVDQLKPEFVVPRTESEQKLAVIWAEVLGTDCNIGRHDNFFALGGDSLKATQIIVRITQIFEIEMPLVALFQSPTLMEQAERIDALCAESSTLMSLFNQLQDRPEAERLALIENLSL